MKNITTGEVTDVKSKEVPTVCMPNESVEISVIGAFREKERKLWAFLVHYAYENFGKVRIHQINCNEVAHIFRSITGCGRTKDLWEYIENLGDIKVLMKDGASDEGFAHLLSWAKVNHETGIVRYEIPAILEELLTKSQYQFSRLRTHFLVGLSGKYSVSLYMLLEMYANRNHPILELSLEELRKTLRIEEGKLESYSHIRQRVIEPAVKEINEKTIMQCEDNIPGQHGAGFTVEYEPIKKGRKIVAIRFTVTKHTKRVAWENKLKNKKTLVENRVLPTLRLNWDKVSNMLNKAGLARLDKYAYETEWREWLWKTGKSDEVKDAEASYVGFIKNRELRFSQ